MQPPCHPRALVVRLLGSVPVSGDSEEGDRVVAHLFRAHATELVRMARLFVVDRNAAEDLVQEAFIRLSRSLGPRERRDEARRVSALDRAEPRP